MNCEDDNAGGFLRSAYLFIPHRPFLANINKPKQLPSRKGYHVILL